MLFRSAKPDTLTTQARRFPLIIAVPLLAVVGCGGGGGAAASVPAPLENGVIGTVQTIRVEQSIASSIQPAIAGGANSTAAYDGTYWYTVSGSGTAMTVNYFVDQAMTQPAGTALITQAPFLTNPTVYTVIFNITKGPRPTTGSLEYGENAPSNVLWETQGTLNIGPANNAAQDFSVAIALQDSSNTIQGTSTVTGSAYTVNLPGLQATMSGSGRAVTYSEEGQTTVSPGSVNVGFFGNVQPTGTTNNSIEMTNGTTATWNAAGAGNIQFSNGSSAKIASFDAGQ